MDDNIIELEKRLKNAKDVIEKTGEYMTIVSFSAKEYKQEIEELANKYNVSSANELFIKNRIYKKFFNLGLNKEKIILFVLRLSIYHQIK